MAKRTSGARDQFRSKWGFILACIGSAVGMGNIWRFPVLVSVWGGLTFLIPYFLFVILIGSTGVVEEMALGRLTRHGPVGAFAYAAGERNKKELGAAVGVVPVVGSLALAIGYTCVMAWIFKYTVMAISGDLFALGTDLDAIGGTFGATASAWGANLWVVIAVAASCLIMAFGVGQGIETANKIMMPVLLVLFVGLAVYISLQSGAADGFRYIFTLNPAGLADPRLWVYAFGQAFFSLSIAGNGTVIYGSYLSDKADIPHAARCVALFDTMAALLAAVVLIPAMATTGAALESGGPGLMFIYLVNVFNGMRGGRIVEVIFFVSVLFAGLSSIMNMYEVGVSFCQDRLKLRRVPATILTHALGGAVALCIQAIVSEWMDVVSIYVCPIGALLAGIMFFWVLKKKTAMDAVTLSAKKPIRAWFYPLGKYVYCLLALLALVLGAILGGIG